MNTLISSRIFNRKHQPIGVVVAVKDPLTKSVNIGWSLTCKKDKFDKVMGMAIALGRASGSNIPVPHSIKGQVQNMQDRAARYFKDASLAWSIAND